MAGEKIGNDGVKIGNDGVKFGNQRNNRIFAPFAPSRHCVKFIASSAPMFGNRLSGLPSDTHSSLFSLQPNML